MTKDIKQSGNIFTVLVAVVLLTGVVIHTWQLWSAYWILACATLVVVTVCKTLTNARV